MNKARKLLIQASQRLDLPSDIVAGIPRIELLGLSELSLEPHRGLLEYSDERISVSTTIGNVTAIGAGLVIKRMNANRITVVGTIHQIRLMEGEHG